MTDFALDLEAFPADFNTAGILQRREKALKDEEETRHCEQKKTLARVRARIFKEINDNLTKTFVTVKFHPHDRLDPDYRDVLERELYERFPNRVYFYEYPMGEDVPKPVLLDPSTPFDGVRDFRYAIKLAE